MNYADLKAADAALAIADLSEAAAALNAQTVTVVRDVPCDDARSVILATGEYGGLVLLSRQVPSDTVPAQLVAAAITAIATLDNAKVIQATDPGKWIAVQSMLGAFMQAGVLSQASHDALVAMREMQAPVWPPLDAGDIQTARNQP